MVAARDAFLAAGHYDFISPPWSPDRPTAADRPTAGLVVDAGAGTGHHLAARARRPARRAVWPWTSRSRRCAGPPGPIRAPPPRSPTPGRLRWPTASAPLLLNVFAPRNGPSSAGSCDRTARSSSSRRPPTTWPSWSTALGLIRVDPAKADRVAASLGGSSPWPTQAGTPRPTATATGAEVRTLVGMGPSAWHVDPASPPDRSCRTGSR